MIEMTEKEPSTFPLHFQTCQIPNVVSYKSGSLDVCGYLLPEQ